jgi:hypothetical protein
MSSAAFESLRNFVAGSTSGDPEMLATALCDLQRRSSAELVAALEEFHHTPSTDKERYFATNIIDGFLCCALRNIGSNLALRLSLVGFLFQGKTEISDESLVITEQTAARLNRSFEANYGQKGIRFRLHCSDRLIRFSDASHFTPGTCAELLQTLLTKYQSNALGSFRLPFPPASPGNVVGAGTSLLLVVAIQNEFDIRLAAGGLTALGPTSLVFGPSNTEPRDLAFLSNAIDIFRGCEILLSDANIECLLLSACYRRALDSHPT